MNRKAIFIITALMLCAGFAQAQNDEDEIEVITDEGALDVIDVPVGMMLEVDSLLNLYNARNYLQEENCNYRDVNPEFPRETYIERLQRIPSIMEMPYNEVVRKFIDRYAVKLRRSVGYMLGASNFYMPIFEQALETYNLPLELKYLPVIESALSPKATSRVGAAGLWQFMLATGKQYGLEVTSLVDERRDPIKSSDAAARYLRDLFRIYHDWSLVIAAYNCGPENINKAIHRAGPGEAASYALSNLEDRGYLIIGPGAEVYPGMIVGEHNRDVDITVNVTKGKHLTNMRSKSADDMIQLTPYRRMTLEECVTFINEDECIEVTPEILRLRKTELDPIKRKQMSKRPAEDDD